MKNKKIKFAKNPTIEVSEIDLQSAIGNFKNSFNRKKEFKRAITKKLNLNESVSLHSLDVSVPRQLNTRSQFVRNLKDKSDDSESQSMESVNGTTSGNEEGKKQESLKFIDNPKFRVSNPVPLQQSPQKFPRSKNIKFSSQNLGNIGQFQKMPSQEVKFRNTDIQRVSSFITMNR